MEQFTPNQIFWITYGYSWCMKQNDQNLVNQVRLLVDTSSNTYCFFLALDKPTRTRLVSNKPGNAGYPFLRYRLRLPAGFTNVSAARPTMQGLDKSMTASPSSGKMSKTVVVSDSLRGVEVDKYCYRKRLLTLIVLSSNQGGN